MIVKEAAEMEYCAISEIYTKDNLFKTLKIIKSLENYSSKLDKLLEKTKTIEQISLKAGK